MKIKETLAGSPNSANIEKKKRKSDPLEIKVKELKEHSDDSNLNSDIDDDQVIQES